MKITSDENVNQAVEQMVQAIRNTDAYMEYRRQLGRIKEQPELKSRSMTSGQETLNCRPAKIPISTRSISSPERMKHFARIRWCLIFLLRNWLSAV